MLNVGSGECVSSILAGAIERATKVDVEARNRVNISLAEYEDMKKQIAKLRDDNLSFRHLLDKLNFPIYDIEGIVPDTITITYSELIRGPLDGSLRKCRIEFDVKVDGRR